MPKGARYARRHGFARSLGLQPQELMRPSFCALKGRGQTLAKTNHM